MICAANNGDMLLKGLLPATHRPLRADNATIKFAAQAIPWLPPP